LERILVYEVEGVNNSRLNVAIDPLGEYLPERNQEKGLLQRRGRNRNGLVAELIMVLTGVIALGKAYKDSKHQEDHFMGKDENVNKYCVSLDQMINSNIRVPFGIIGIASNEIKLAAVTPLEKIAKKYVFSEFGNHNGYEVWVPKVSVNLCGSDYNNVVCNIKNENGAIGVWMQPTIPTWEIKGGCDIEYVTHNNRNNDNHDDNRNNNQSNETRNNGYVPSPPRNEPNNPPIDEPQTPTNNSSESPSPSMPTNPCSGSKIYQNGVCIARPCDGQPNVCDVIEECKPACVSTGFESSYLESSCNSSTLYSVCDDGSRCIPVCLEK
jgi:hypothetical protein